MDSYKKLSEELLKNDGIDPANIPDSERAMFEQLLDKHLNSGQSKQVLWRIIMKSKITKYAAAAVIIIACLLGLTFWRSTGSGIALADVLARIEQITAYTYQVHSTITREQTTEESAITVLISKEHGIRMTSKIVNRNKDDVTNEQVYQVYILPKKYSVIIINHKEKEYIPREYEGGQYVFYKAFYKEEYNDPQTIIKQIIDCDHISLGQSVMEGVTLEGFQTTDLSYEGGFLGEDDFMGGYQKVDVKLWVDMKTFLPVRLEEDIVSKLGIHKHEISSDFRWNIVVNAADFEPNIPDDYTLPVGNVIFPATNEENTIKAFRLYDDLIGKYPVLLDGIDEAFKEEVRKHLVDEDSYEGLSDDEKTRMTNMRILLDSPLLFYYELIEENKDPAYHGETVGPDDADKVLLRWKLDDGQYRVIFGDLSTKTVTVDELAEIEKP